MFSLHVESVEWIHPSFLQVQKLRPREAQALSQGDQLTKEQPLMNPISASAWAG